jgi:putative component of toxin-antitoxin plasmid stabilization module
MKRLSRKFHIKVKKPIEITLSTIHVGDVRRVVTLGINQKDLAQKFLTKLQKDDGQKATQLNTRIERVSNHDKYENDQIFNNVGDGLYEFKRPGLRLYAFYDSLGDKHQLILCTSGGTKNKKKEQNNDIKKAKQLKDSYFEAKADKSTRITIEEDTL